MSIPSEQANPFHTADTHEVFNQPHALENYNTFLSDIALQEAIRREGGDWAWQQLVDFGEFTGRGDVIKRGTDANRFKPTFKTHDQYGRRVDEVEFHPAYHQLMDTAISHGLHSLPWTHEGNGGHVARAGLYYLQTQVEAGHGCPVTMTFASIPTLRKQPDIAEKWVPLVTSRQYDSRNVPFYEKPGLTIGMAMTEKQGGSDVRANTTQARPLDQPGGGKVYELVGHKYFVSAPMCDGFLVLAYAPDGLSCFLVPRWREDGSKNPLQLQQLKDKMGNASNASSETELRGAHGYLIGDEGRGVANILEMVAMTRFDCMIGSSAGMRQAVAQITHHCHHRAAFGKALDEQPLMQNVLADLIIENEAALALTMRIARALDSAGGAEKNEHEQLISRIGTAVGKYWICKRTPNHAYEAMECIGGSAVMETSLMPRLYREAPVNAIWEGSGNVQALDLLRVLARNPETLEALLIEMEKARGMDHHFDRYLDRVKNSFADKEDVEYRARQITEQLAVSFQASLLLRQADTGQGNADVAEAFCGGRLGETPHQMYGTLPKGLNCKAIIDRARPQV